jgi:hypothetical protein
MHRLSHSTAPFDCGVAVEHPPGLTRPGSFMTRKSVPFTTFYSISLSARTRNGAAIFKSNAFAV